MGKPKVKYEEYKCKMCGKRFSDRTRLVQHMLVHTSDKPFSCPHCKHMCKSRKYLSAHIKKVHKKPTGNPCKFCGKKFHFKCLLEKHMYVHTNERPYKCEVCDKGFNSGYSLSNHRLIHSGEKPFKCEFCSYACRDGSTLRKHQERHMGITRLYQCTACDKSYKTKRVLKIHVGEVHMDQDMKTKPCPHCGKMFAATKNLTNHIKISHERLYECKCDICGVTLSNKYNMRAHLNKHLDFRPFKCSFQGCGKKFKDKTALKKHAIIHYPDKQFVCEICDRRFTRIHRLKTHQLQHQAKMKCVACDYCGKSFYNKNYVRSHIVRKHLHRQHYECDLCGLRTSNKPSIVMHLKYGHAAEADRQCKICNKTYKKHIYLKLHYWNTHCVKYKMNRHTLRSPKKRRNYLIEENQNLKELELLHEVKVEPISESEDVKEPDLPEVLETSPGTSQLNVRKNFADFFIEHIINPSASNQNEELNVEDTDIVVDVKTHEEAEEMRREMLMQWRSKREMKTWKRVRRGYGGGLKGIGSGGVKNEKIEITHNKIQIEVPIKDESKKNLPEVTDIHKQTDNSNIVDNTDKQTIDNNNISATVVVLVDENISDDLERITTENVTHEFIENDTNIADKEAKVDDKEISHKLTHIADDNINDRTEKATESDEIATGHRCTNNIYSREYDISIDKDLDTKINKDKKCVTDKSNSDFDNVRQKSQINSVVDNDMDKISDGINETIKEKSSVDDPILNNETSESRRGNIKLVKDNISKNLRRCIKKRKAHNNNNGGRDSKQRQLKRKNIDNVLDYQSGSRTQKHSTREERELLKSNPTRRVGDDDKEERTDKYEESSKDNIPIAKVNKSTNGSVRHVSEKDKDSVSDADDDDKGTDKDEGNGEDNFKIVKVQKHTKRRVRNNTKKIEDSDDDYKPDEDEENSENNIELVKVNKHTKRCARNVTKKIDCGDDEYKPDEDEAKDEENSEDNKLTKIRVRNVTKQIEDSDADDDYKPEEDEETDRDEENSEDNFEIVKEKNTKRRVRKFHRKGKDKIKDADKEPNNTSSSLKINIHQCYVCFKLYETKEKLLDHCKEHFDVCNVKMLKKCPLCDYVTKLDLRRHIRAIHKINVNILYGTLKDRKNNNNKSRFYFNVDNSKVDEIEVIPSIKNLNRQAFLKIDRKRRENNDRGLKKTKLVKKDGEWIVEKVAINAKDYVLPDTVDKEVVNDEDYTVKMRRLSRIAKKNGQKMLFPCDKCEKICQTLSALKLHMRRHDPDAKPFKKKVWKHKLSEEELRSRDAPKEVSTNRYAKPKPIKNKHKCDPKLKDFYENNIKGGDVEFWQFLKIFNKMTRENVNDFADLEKRTEFGNHFYHRVGNSDSVNENHESGGKDTDLGNEKDIPQSERREKKRNPKDNEIKGVNRKGVGKSFKRTIMISRKEYIRRKTIQDALRKKNMSLK